LSRIEDNTEVTDAEIRTSYVSVALKPRYVS